MSGKSGMQPEDVYRLTGAGDPRLSPDGSTVAFVVATIDPDTKEARAAIWAVAADGSEPPRRLTFGPRSDTNPRWSPDGRWLAFTSDREGEVDQLYVMPVGRPGEPIVLTDLQEKVQAPVWSPDGRRLAFLARDHDPSDDIEDVAKRPPRRITRLQYRLDHEGFTFARRRHVYVVGREGEAPAAQLTDGDMEDGAPSWSPDGTRIAFTSARHEDWDISTTTDVYVVSADGGEPERLTTTDGACDSVAWSPDGTRIAYRFTPGEFDEPRHGLIAVLDVASRERTLLGADLDRTCAPYPPIGDLIWDGDHLVFPIEDGGRVPLYRASADGSAPPAPMFDPEGWITGYDLVDGTIVTTVTTTSALAEVFIGDRRLSEVGAAFLVEVDVVGPEPFTATSADGTQIDAWVIRPAGFEEGARYPAVLNIHGGPFTQYGLRFFDEFQVQSGAGYGVIFANPRGSSGYSEAFGRAIRGPVSDGEGWGSVDFDDLMAVVDEAVKRFDWIDPDRLGVMGGSYGGYMTSWIVGHTDRFACGISERAVNDMASEDGTCDFAGFFRGYLGDYPWNAPDAYRDTSPLTFADRITTPLLILHSEDDLRCPINQAEQLFTVLRNLKREVEFVRFPGECHELTRSGSPTHRVQRFEIVLEWLDRYLKA
ncbi:MAG: S9 family peptidase [Actinomycetota bacterium]